MRADLLDQVILQRKPIPIADLRSRKNVVVIGRKVAQNLIFKAHYYTDLIIAIRWCNSIRLKSLERYTAQ
jgi:hypothetical protein